MYLFVCLSWQTKEEVASTLEAVQNIQTTTQALHKSKEIYNTKTVEQERLRKEGATQRDVDKVCWPGDRRRWCVAEGGRRCTLCTYAQARVITAR